MELEGAEMRKYRFSTGMGIEKVVVDDLYNGRSTIYYSDGHIEKDASYRYRADEHKELWFDSLHDCLTARLQHIQDVWGDSLIGQDAEKIVQFLHKLIQDNPLDDIYNE